MKEKQAFRYSLVLWVCLAASLILVSCDKDQVKFAWLPGRSVPVTLTPFQANSPTPKPTHTVTPTITVTSTPQPTSTLIGCSSERGSLEKHEVPFPSGLMSFRVYLPPCYGAEKAIRYPVLYMIHGQTFNDDQWDRLGLDEAADSMISSEQAPPFLIVMPLEVNTFEDIFISPFPGQLIDGLINWIDANYQTCAERGCRAIGGLSRGGAWALRLGLIHWELFGAIGLHSTPPFIGDLNRLPAWLNEIPTDQIPRIYMDAGRRDWYLKEASQLEELLVEFGVPHEWYLFNGEHDEAYWSSHVIDYLAWYSRPWNDQVR